MSETPSKNAAHMRAKLAYRKTLEALKEERERTLPARQASSFRLSRVLASSSTSPNHASVGRSSSTIRTSDNQEPVNMAASSEGELLTPLKYKHDRYSADMSELLKGKGKGKVIEDTLDDDDTFVETEEDLKAVDDTKSMKYTGFQDVEEGKAEFQVYMSELAKKLYVRDDEYSILPVEENLQQEQRTEERNTQSIKMSDLARKLQIHDDEDAIMPYEVNITKPNGSIKKSTMQGNENPKEEKLKIIDNDGIRRTEETMNKLKAALVEHMTKTGFSEKECDMVCRAMKERKMVFKECKDIRNKLLEDLRKHSPGYVFKFIPAKQQWLQEVRLHERLLPGVEHDLYDVRNMPFAPQYFTINQGTTDHCTYCKRHDNPHSYCPYNRILSCNDNRNHPDFTVCMGSIRPVGPECPICWEEFKKKYNFMEHVMKETSYNVLAGFPTADQVIEMKNLHCKIIVDEGVDVYKRLHAVSSTVESVRIWTQRYPKSYGDDNRGAARDVRDFENIVKKTGGLNRL